MEIDHWGDYVHDVIYLTIIDNMIINILSSIPVYCFVNAVLYVQEDKKAFFDVEGEKSLRSYSKLRFSDFSLVQQWLVLHTLASVAATE